MSSSLLPIMALSPLGPLGMAAGYMFGSYGTKHPSNHGYGKKSSGSSVMKGVKSAGSTASKVASVAGTVGDVAGVVGNVAAAALPFTAAIPGVGEVVAGVAAGGKALQAGAGLVKRSAAKVATASRMAEEGGHAIDALRHGQVAETYRASKRTVAEGKSLRKQIERK